MGYTLQPSQAASLAQAEPLLFSLYFFLFFSPFSRTLSAPFPCPIAGTGLGSLEAGESSRGGGEPWCCSENQSMEEIEDRKGRRDEKRGDES